MGNISLSGGQILQSKSIDYNNGIVSRCSFSAPGSQFIGSPVAQFTFNTSGTYVYDSVNTYSGLGNLTTWDAGLMGSAIVFNGSTSYVLVSGIMAGDLGSYIAPNAQQKTITSWINYTGSSLGISGGNACIIGGRFGDNFALVVSGNKQLIYREDDSFVGTTGSINGSGWDHVALTSSLSAGSPYYHNYNIYINGEVSKTGSFLHQTSNPSTQGYFSIGYEGRQKFAFNGKIDELRIYDVILTPSQIKDIYNQGLGTEIYNVVSTSGLNYYVTANGSNYEQLNYSGNDNHTFTNPGSDLKFKIEVGSNTYAQINSINLNYS